MKNKTNVGINDGFMSIGDNNINIMQNNPQPINWDILDQEISALKSSSDGAIQKFANEAAEVAKKKDTQGIHSILSKWIPCISDLISSSYYILEIAKTLNILK